MPRLSFGCSACRKRRVKCDERGGGCGNCERYGSPCPGYPDKFDVVLRMSTAKVPGRPLPLPAVSSAAMDEARPGLPVKPVRRRGLREHAVRAGAQRETPMQVQVQRQMPMQMPIQMQTQVQTQTQMQNHPPHLGPSLVGTLVRYMTIDNELRMEPDDLALTMYYCSYCVDGSKIWPADTIRQQGNGCLYAAVKVLGNVAIRQTWSSPPDTQAVPRTYAAALRLLNQALASPRECLADSTLLATLILGALEIKAAPSKSLDSWKVHTKGAAALLTLRGPSQVTSRLGSALYFQVATYATSTCIVSGERVPLEMKKLREATRPYLLDENHPSWKYQGVTFRYTDLMADLAASASERNPDRLSLLVDEAHSVYQDLRQVFVGADSSWDYGVIPSERFHPVVGYEHVYPTVLASQIWNGCRAAIVSICSAVAHLATLLPADFPLKPASREFLDSAVYIINATVMDVLAAVPDTIMPPVLSANLSPSSPASGSNPPETTPSYPISGHGHSKLVDEYLPAGHSPVFREDRPDSQAVPYMNGCQLQWSVYFAARSRFVARPARVYLVQILDTAARVMSVAQWKTTARELRAELELEATCRPESPLAQPARWTSVGSA